MMKLLYLIVVCMCSINLFPQSIPPPHQPSEELISQNPTNVNIAEPKHVLIVYNAYSSMSDSVKSYYKTKRNIPTDNEFKLYLSDTTFSNHVIKLVQNGEIIKDTTQAWADSTSNAGSSNHAWQYFNDRIFIPIQNYLKTKIVNGDTLKNIIRYIVLCKGVPMKIQSKYDSSGVGQEYRKNVALDPFLCFLNQPDPSFSILNFYNTSFRNGNSPYYHVDYDYTFNYRFKSNYYTLYNLGIKLSYLVSRLDGLTKTKTLQMIDKSAAPDYSGENTWVIDTKEFLPSDDPENYWIYNSYYHPWYLAPANSWLQQFGFNTNYDGLDRNSIVTNNGSVMGYSSWGIHGGLPTGYVLDNLNFQYANGAVFNTIESFNGNSMGVSYSDRNIRRAGHGLLSEFIYAGGTGGICHAWEPTLDGIVEDQYFFAHYAMGYSLVDAAYIGMWKLGWQNIVIGDPLTTIAWGKQSLTEDKTLSGTNLVTGEVTVPSGKTLTIAANAVINFKHNGSLVVNGNLTIGQGAKLNFFNGSSIVVNGVLTANGISTNKITFDRSVTTGTWGPLKFDGTGASASVLDNVVVKNATNIQIVNNANVTIQNSTIQDCTQGIYVYNASPQILNNQILYPIQHGIYVDASGKNPLMLNNTITKASSQPTYKQNQGIILYNGTLGYIAHNDIRGFDHGIYLGGSNAYFTNYSWQNFYPNNRLTANYYGIMVGWGSYLNAGAGMNYCWNNSIANNDNYNIYVYQSSTAWAQYNYWGVGSPKQYADGTSNLYALPALASDPWGSQSAVKGFIPTDVAMPEVQLMQTSDKFTSAIKGSFKQVQSAALNNDLGTTKDEDEFMKGIRLEQEGKIDEAIDYLKQLVKSKKYGLYALTGLAGLKERYGKENVETYFEDLLKDPNEGNKSRIKKHLANFYLNKNEDDRAVALFDELKDDKNSKRDNFEGLYEKFNFMIHKKKDLETSKTLLAELKNKFADDADAMIHITTAELLISEKNNFALSKKQSESEVTTEVDVPKEYALFNNYPNPFNPVTTITYQLPKDGYVTLKIFDILGNEVKTLVNDQKEVGKYTVQFDASSLASGMYVYQLRVNDYTSTKKMLLLK